MRWSRAGCSSFGRAEVRQRRCFHFAFSGLVSGAFPYEYWDGRSVISAAQIIWRSPRCRGRTSTPSCLSSNGCLGMRSGWTTSGSIRRTSSGLCAACERRGWTVRRFPLSRCPYIALPDSWAMYLSGLSANRRHALLRSERTLHGAHRVSLTEYAADRMEEGWRCLLGLHIKRWGAEGHLAMQALARLHGKFASLLPPRGAVWLASLDLDGKPAAAWYGFSVGDTVYFYNGGGGCSVWGREAGGVLSGVVVI